MTWERGRVFFLFFLFLCLVYLFVSLILYISFIFFVILCNSGLYNEYNYIHILELNG